MKEAYRKQVQLLLNILPEVAKEECFAMHGGTAINLFVRDMPRLSVDNRDPDPEYDPAVIRNNRLLDPDPEYDPAVIRNNRLLTLTPNMIQP